MYSNVREEKYGASTKARFLTSACTLSVLTIFQQFDKQSLSASQSTLSSITCDESALPSLLIVVLTATRHASLRRLLASLSAAQYGCAKVDLHIVIDIRLPLNAESVELSKTSARIAPCLETGSKSRHRRLAPQVYPRVGSRYHTMECMSTLQSWRMIWKSVPTITQFLVSSTNMAPLGAQVAAFCLHPNDWEVRVEPRCNSENLNVLYMSPEPYWGPIWKYGEWRRYVDWVFGMSEAQHFVPDSVAGIHTTSTYEMEKMCSLRGFGDTTWILPCVLCATHL